MIGERIYKRELLLDQQYWLPARKNDNFQIGRIYFYMLVRLTQSHYMFDLLLQCERYVQQIVMQLL